MQQSYRHILLGSTLVVGLVGCAPPLPVSHQQGAGAVVGGSTASPESDWCLGDPLPAPVANPRQIAQERVERGLMLLGKARLSGDPGDLVQAAACADLAFATDDAVPALAAEPAQNLLRLQVLMARHEFATARDFAQQWLKQPDAPPLAQLLLSDCLLELGDVGAAALALDQAMRARPDQNAYARAAHLRWLRGDIESAKLIYADVLQNRDPNHPEPSAQRFLELARLVQKQGDQAGAIALVEAGLAAMPMHRDSLLWLAHARLDADQYDAAQALLTRLEAGFIDIPVLALKRRLAAHAGDAAAVQQLNQRIDAMGRRGEGFAWALDLLARRESPNQVLALLAIERRSRDGLAFDAAEADARLQLGEPEAALKAIDRALRYQTPDPDWWQLRANILSALGRAQEAKQALTKVDAIQVLARTQDLAQVSASTRPPIAARSE